MSLLPKVVLDKKHFIGEANVIVYKEGNIVYALDNRSKTIIDKGEDASTVIQSAINALTAGGKIFVKNGLYVLSSRNLDSANIYYSILVNTSNLTLEFEPNVTLKLAGGLQANIIQIGRAGVGGLTNVRLLGYPTLDGNRANQTNSGVDGNQCGVFSTLNSYVEIEAIIKSCMRQGLYDSVDKGTKARVYAYDCGLEGISISACSDGDYVAEADSCGQLYPNIAAAQSGIHISGNSQRNRVLGWSHHNKGNGFTMISDAGTNGCQNNDVIMHTWMNQLGGWQIGDPTANTYTDFNRLRGSSYKDGASGIANADGIKLYNARRNRLKVLVFDVQYSAGVHFFSGSLNNVVELVSFDDQATHTQTYAWLSESGAFNEIIGGDVSLGGFTAGIHSSAIGSIKVKNLRGYDTENFKSTGISVAVGTGGAYGSASAIISLSGVITYPRVKITWGGTFGTGETVTVKVEAVYTDGTTAYVEKSATATGSAWLTDDDVLSLITQGKDIVKLNVYAKSSAASTSVTVTVDAYGKA